MKIWLFGVIGGTIVVLHLMMVFIIKYAFTKREKWAFEALYARMLGWFCVDSSVSAYWEEFHNIWMINLVALLRIGLPLIMTWPAFRKMD